MNEDPQLTPAQERAAALWDALQLILSAWGAYSLLAQLMRKKR